MLYIDTETYNAQKDISAGTYEYARTCEVLLVSYALSGGPVHLWDATAGAMPADLNDFLLDDTLPLTAHNAMFDRNVIGQALGIKTRPTRWRCTMAQALAHGLPASLGALAPVIGVPADSQKLAHGKKLINRFCKPAPSNHKADRYTKDTHPDEWAMFCDYAVQDIFALREIHKRLPTWNMNEGELALYHLDQKINDRGFAVDTELVAAGARAAVSEKETLSQRFRHLTKDRVASPTMRAKFLDYLNTEFGLGLENTQAATLKRLLQSDTDMPFEARELIQIAMRANKTSTAKYAALAPAVSPDGRFRGGLQYSGASRTRRWSGRTFQPQNLPSRGLPPNREVARYIEALKLDMHEVLFDDQMRFGSSALRGVLVAPQGRKLVVSDLSNIEGRANAWLAGETWKIKAFEEFDSGHGFDLYVLAVARMLGKNPTDITKDERNNLGKVSELAFGYQGGVVACQNFARGRMEALTPILEESAAEFLDQAHYNWDMWGEERNAGSETSRPEWLASEAVKLAWRSRHPRISKLWKACETAAVNAVRKSGATFTAGDKLKFRMMRAGGNRYLLMRLPSGQYCCYFDPRVTDAGKLSFMRANPITKRWERSGCYGGMLVENACQSLSRDILASAMPRAEKGGYEIVLTVHDELVTQAPDTPDFSAAHLSEILSTNPAYAQGLPLAAAGFETHRYRKD